MQVSVPMLVIFVGQTTPSHLPKPLLICPVRYPGCFQHPMFHQLSLVKEGRETQEMSLRWVDMEVEVAEVDVAEVAVALIIMAMGIW
jgi:hypothetical protein